MNAVRGKYRMLDYNSDLSQEELNSDASEEQELVHLSKGQKGDNDSMVVWFSEREGKAARCCYVNRHGIAEIAEVKGYSDI